MKNARTFLLALLVLMLPLMLMIFSACSSDCSVLFDSDGGSDVEYQVVKKGDKLVEPAEPTKPCCTFDGWYNGKEKWDFAEDEVKEDLWLKAAWTEHHVFSVKEQTDEYLESAATCQEPDIYYYKCENCDEKGPWTYKGQELGPHSFTEKKTNAKYLKTAASCYNPAEYYYKCALCNEKGTESYIHGQPTTHRFNMRVMTDEYLKKPATCMSVPVYYTKCEFCDDYSELSYTYSFGKRIPHELDGNGKCSGCGYTYIYFGEYPQTVKHSSVTIKSTRDERGYYLGSDGAYYAKVVAVPDLLDTKFSDGSWIEEDTVYYFKVEPIRWRVLKKDGETALLMCDSILDTIVYDKSVNNNYKDSDIRAWLNSDFYSVAFDTEEKGRVITTEVDNSAATTASEQNAFGCENTNDKVFLLSYADMTDTEYGFESDHGKEDVARMLIASDYSRATGISFSAQHGTAYWWLRSPYDKKYYAWTSSSGGDLLVFLAVDAEWYGVAPAIQIELA